MPVTSRLEFLEKILGNNFAFSDAEDAEFSGQVYQIYFCWEHY